ncbi:MAG TPA: condensation domain-containing protein, partial [Longimicrobium sp.]|nr:condensation domain-containing protein [Longimicrobium sp.]
DGWSMGVLFRELSALYAAYREGRGSPLPEPAVRYADYAAWQREQLRGEAMERQLDYWRERLSDAPALLELPTDCPRPAVQTYRGALETAELPRALVERLEALGRGEGATLFMVLLAAFQVLLSKYAGSGDVVVGTPIAGRTRREVEGLIGFFVNTLALRTDLSGDPCFREVLRSVREVTLGAYEHQDVPFERLVEELRPERSSSHAPLFQVMFTLRDGRDARLSLPGVRAGDVTPELATAKFDLTLGIAVDAGFRAEVKYGTDLFERATIERMLGHLARVLAEVAADPDLRLSDLELVDAAERRLVVEEWNRTGTAYPSDRSVARLFAEQAMETPHAVAVVSGGASLTYRELELRSNRLARHLVGLGVGPEVRVGLCLERSAEMVVAILAILKAGGAYVPLDPGYPAERLELMLADSAVAVLLTEDALRQRLPLAAGTVVARVDGEREDIERESADAVDGGAGPGSLAYVMYTSGSTGTPKGVAVEHRSVVRLVRGASYVDLGPDEVFLQAAPVSFDASTLELWGALLNGGRVVLAPGAAPSLEELGRAIVGEGVT